MNFQCNICGKNFEADPDSMVETGFSPILTDEELDEDSITVEELQAMNEFELSEIGLTLEDREKLLNGEDIINGGMCICKECQDDLAE